MACSPPGSSVRSIFQVRTLEWVAVSSRRGSSHPRDQTCVSCGSCIAGGCFTAEAPGEAQTECTRQNDSVETRPSHLVMVFEGRAPMMSSMPLKTSERTCFPVCLSLGPPVRAQSLLSGTGPHKNPNLLTTCSQISHFCVPEK